MFKEHQQFLVVVCLCSRLYVSFYARTSECILNFLLNLNFLIEQQIKVVLNS